MYLKVLCVLAFTLMSIQGFAKTCDDNLRVGYRKELKSLNNKYLLSGGQLKSAVGAYWKFPDESRAQNEVVILIHGFIASPFEMVPLHNYFLSRGYAVYSPLLEGYGASHKIANISTKEQWKSSVSRAVNLVGTCYKKIHLVGFSLGGGLIVDHLLSNGYDKNGLNSNGIQIASMTLLSPYFSVSVSATDWAVKALEWFGDLKNVKVKTLYRWTGLNDLAVPSEFPQYYNEVFPMAAVGELVNFGDEVRQKISQVSSKYSIPSHFIISENDSTVSLSAAETAYTTVFENQSQFVFSLKEKVPHQVTYYLDVVVKNGQSLRDYLNTSY